MPAMKAILCVLATVEVLSGTLSAQCTCVAATAVTNPQINVQGPPAWTVGGLIQDLGTVPGVCIKQGCERHRSCSHTVRIEITLTYPTGTAPAPTLGVVLKHNNSIIGTLPFPHTSVTTNPNGATTLAWDTSANDPSFLVGCLARNQAETLAGELAFTPPGGGAPTTSGGAALTCAGCGE